MLIIGSGLVQSHPISSYCQHLLRSREQITLMKLDVARGDLTFDDVQYGVISNHLHLSSRLYRNLACVRCSSFRGSMLFEMRNFLLTQTLYHDPRTMQHDTVDICELTSISANPRSECTSISDERADSELS
jgi:hypothetical protein